MRKKRMYGSLIALLTAVSLVSIVHAADLGLTLHQIDSSQFPKVRVYVTVADSQGLPITGLDTQAFAITEDGKQVKDLQVQSIVDSQEPIAVALNVDVSGSMKDSGSLDAAKQAATAFIETMGTTDSVAIVSFADDVKVVQGFTADKGVLNAGVQKLATDGDTSLYDAVTQSAQLMGALPQQRKIILVVTDGEDTKSKQSLDDAVAAAKAAKAVVLAVGLGPGVKKDVLDKLASATTGQAVYVDKPDQLRQVFLSFGDQLRRQYVLQYTSQLPGDDKQHEVVVQSNYRGQKAEAKGSFAAKRTPLTLDVKGITSATRITGAQSIDVAVTGGSAKTVELLVDDQQRATADTAPYVLKWDATKESPGMHRVVVRATDATGVTTDKEFVVEVAGAAQAAPTVAASPAKAGAASPVAQDSTILLAIGALVALALVGFLVWFFALRRPRVAALPRIETAPRVEMDDRTENIDLPVQAKAIASRAGPAAAAAPKMASDAGATVVGAIPSDGAGATVVSEVPAPPPPPKARLQIAQQGAQRVVIAAKTETILGRLPDNEVTINDPLASRKHARIIREDRTFWVEDMGSKNGTSLNGRQITTRQKLVPNDQIKIGDVTITFTLDEG